MELGVKKIHPVSDSETETPPSLGRNKLKSSGLMPRKDNNRACKAKKSKTTASASICNTQAIQTPVIDNVIRPSHSMEEDVDPSDDNPILPATQQFSQSQLDIMNDKLNTLIEFVNRTNEHVEGSEDGQISEDEEEDNNADDSLRYFQSITEKGV